MKYIGVVVSPFIMGMPIAHSEEPAPRHYYGAKLEPVAHVLHGAGQGKSQDVVDYAKTLESYDPAIFMDYCGVKNAGTKFASNLRISSSRGDNACVSSSDGAR